MYQPNLLKGRTIFITGGGTGLGRSMALRFAELGANIFLTGRREEPLKQTTNDIRAKGAQAAYGIADVRDIAAVESVVAAAEEKFGSVDILVNNAAGNFIARSEKLSPNAFNAVIGIVLTGTAEGYAVLINTATKEVVRLKTGEGHDGWILHSVSGREAVFEKNNRTAVIAMPALNGEQK